MPSMYDGHGGSEVRLSSLENLDPQKKLTLTPWEPGKRTSRMAPQFGGVIRLQRIYNFLLFHAIILSI